MRKTGLLLSIVLIIIIIFACLPVIDGYVFRRNYFQLIDIANRDGRVKLTVTEYKMGYFSSTAKVQVEPTQALPQGRKSYIELVSEISHGPFVKNMKTGGYQLASANIHTNIFMFVSTFRTPSLITIDSIVSGMGNHWHNMISRPGINSNIANVTINWGGIDGYIDFKMSGGMIKTLNSKITFGALAVQNNGQIPSQLRTLNIEPIIYENTSTHESSYIWSGNASFTIPKASAIMANGAQSLVDTFVIKSSVSLPNSTMFNMIFNVSVQKIQFPVDLPSVQPANFTLTFTNFSQQGLREATSELKAAATTYPNNLAQVYMASLPKILTPQSVITKDVSINTSLGAITSHSKADLPANLPMPLTFDTVIQKANLDINVRASIPLVEKLIAYYAVATQKPVAKPTQQTANQDMFNQTVAVLLKSGEVNLQQSMQLIGYHDQRLTPDVFAANVDKLNLQPNTAVILKTQYQTFYMQKQQAQQTAALNTPEMQAAANAAMLKQAISTWIQQGYILQDKNDYVFTLTRTNGQFILNGKPMPVMMPPPPLLPPKTP